jgi:hypothetical protein
MFRRRSGSLYVVLVAFAAVIQSMPACGQSSVPSSLDETGQIPIAGKVTHYRIRNLPVSSFPEIPQAIANSLNILGCVIPQTYEAKRPENVIHASLERAGSSDWAVLCSAHARVSLLVFLADASEPVILASSPEMNRLQAHGTDGELGFNWGIDPASPARIHDAQAAMTHRPPAPDHDALADTTLDHGTVYHLYRDGAWGTIPTE